MSREITTRLILGPSNNFSSSVLTLPPARAMPQHNVPPFHPWPQFGGGPAHTNCGRARGPADSPPFVRWHARPYNAESSSPVTSTAAISAAGGVYLGRHDGCAMSYDATTGVERWSTCLYSNASQLLGSPALSADGSRVFFTGSRLFDLDVDAPRIFALDTSDGSVVWRFAGLRAVSPFVGSPAVADDGTVYAGSVDGLLYAVSPAGALLWHHDAGSAVISTPALGPNALAQAQGTALYLATDGGRLVALDAASGAQLWQTQAWAPGGGGGVLLAGAVESSPTVSDDGAHVYVGTWDGALLCFAAATGVEVWRFNVSTSLGISTPLILATPSLSPPDSGVELVYSGTAHLDANSDAPSTLFAVDAATGAVVWATTVSRSVYSGPVVGSGNTLYVGGFGGPGIAAGGVDAFDGATGVLLWSKPLGEHLYASPSMGADGTLFIGGSDGAFFALAPFTPPSPLPTPSAPSALPSAVATSPALVIGLSVCGGFLVAAAALGLWLGVSAWRARKSVSTVEDFDAEYKLASD